MKYKIITGKYETGTEEQKNRFKVLLGDKNTEESFDLYFHWFNIIHEFGHALVDYKKLKLSPADEEQFVNDFAVAYWSAVDEQGYLSRVEEMLKIGLNKLPRPIPKDINYLDYFRENWGDFEMSIEMYGFFQLSCVLNSLKRRKDLTVVLKELGYENIDINKFSRNTYEIVPDTALVVLDDCIKNLSRAGVDLPEVILLFDNDPELHCCEYKKSY